MITELILSINFDCICTVRLLLYEYYYLYVLTYSVHTSHIYCSLYAINAFRGGRGLPKVGVAPKIFRARIARTIVMNPPSINPGSTTDVNSQVTILYNKNTVCSIVVDNW